MTITVSGQVTLPNGTILKLSGSAASKSSTPTMLIGSDRHPVDMTAYPKMKYARFYGPNGFPTDVAPAGVTPHRSYKGSTVVATLNAALNTVSHDEIWEGFHEPDRSSGGPTPSAFKSDYALLHNTVRAHKNGHFIKLCITYIRYMQVQPLPNHAWTDFWTGTADLIGFDCEWDSRVTAMLPTGYPDPVLFFAPVLQIAKQAGKPFVVPELGWHQLASDTDGSGLADWYTRCAVYLRSVGCYAVGAYDTLGSTGDYRLSGKPYLAWKAQM